MSKGFGDVQRHILARLRENTADPTADREMPPYYQSWTPLGKLRVGTPYEYESIRRALGKLKASGVVETRLLREVQWSRTSVDPQHPAARRHTLSRPSHPDVTIWEYPHRNRGSELLHARLTASARAQTSS